MQQQAAHALIIPGDDPPRRSAIKRQLLFFDAVSLPDPEDIALLNDHEVREELPGGTVYWSRRAPYPRSEGYAETLKLILEETTTLRNRGKLRVLTRDQSRHLVDPGSHWVAYSLAVRDEELVRAAIPDHHPGKPAIALPSGVYIGLEISAPGHPSKYSPPPGQPSAMPAIGDEWNALAQIRVGRAIKYLRIATAGGTVPLALDLPNENLLKSVGERAYEGSPRVDQMANTAIAVDAVDPIALEKVLVDMSWSDVISLRKLILPHTAALRALLVQRVTRAIHSGSIEPAAFLQEMSKLRDEYQKAQDEVAKRWTEAGVGLVTRALPVTAALQAGLTALPVPASVGGLVLRILTGLATTAGTMANEAKGWFAARAALKAQPLLFFDTLPATVRRRANETADRG